LDDRQEAEVTPGLVVSAGQRSKALFKIYQGIHAEAQIQYSRMASQSPDLNIKNAWNDLKQAVHARQLSNLTQLEIFCKEEWSKIPAARNQGFISGYTKCLLQAVISAKGGSTQY